MTITERLLNVGRKMEKSPLSEGCRVFFRMAAMTTRMAGEEYNDSEVWFTISAYAGDWADRAEAIGCIEISTALYSLRDHADCKLATC